MSKVHIFTSAAFNYTPKVRLLFESLRQHHPECVLHLALADEMVESFDLASEPFDEIHPLSTLGIAHWQAWSFCHAIVELATAIKPFVLASLLRRADCAKVLYLDPDTVAFSRLDDILDALDTASVVLTPHCVSPEDDIYRVMDNEIGSLKHGVYNLGFVGVASTPDGIAFADWWAKRCYHFCRDAVPLGLFTDQRWVDLAPALFANVQVLRSPRHNVATWNLTQRDLQHSPAVGYTVNGVALGFFHFTGYDSGAHHSVIEQLFAQRSAVLSISAWYAERLLAVAGDPLSAVPWKYANFDDGSSISKAARVVYRERVDLQASFTLPYASGAGSYQEWWASTGQSEYPKLFSASEQTAELARLQSTLTTGFSQ